MIHWLRWAILFSDALLLPCAILQSLQRQFFFRGTTVQNNTVVVARYNEDIAWLDHLRAHSINVEVLQSKDPNAPNFVENFGNEAMKYLRFFYDHYEHLPSRMLLIHAGARDWHDPRPKNETLVNWDWTVAERNGGLAYLPTAAPCLLEDHGTPNAERHTALGRWDHVKDSDDSSECLELEEHSAPQMQAVREAWHEAFESELGPLPQRWVSPCCAQFEVTSAAVRRHSRAFYGSLIRWIKEHDTTLLASEYGQTIQRNHDPQRRDAGHILEVLWVLIFRPVSQ